MLFKIFEQKGTPDFLLSEKVQQGHMESEANKQNEAAKAGAQGMKKTRFNFTCDPFVDDDNESLIPYISDYKELTPSFQVSFPHF